MVKRKTGTHVVDGDLESGEVGLVVGDEFAGVALVLLLQKAKDGNIQSGLESDLARRGGLRERLTRLEEAGLGYGVVFGVELAVTYGQSRAK